MPWRAWLNHHQQILVFHCWHFLQEFFCLWWSFLLWFLIYLIYCYEFVWVYHFFRLSIFFFFLGNACLRLGSSCIIERKAFRPSETHSDLSSWLLHSTSFVSWWLSWFISVWCLEAESRIHSGLLISRNMKMIVPIVFLIGHLGTR